MAAMRLGCLFSNETNVRYLHKAQSPYSVNMLAVLAAQAAVEDVDYVRNYVAEALAARELLCLGPGETGHRLRAQLGEFRVGPLRRRAPSRCATRFARAEFWCATAAMKRRAASASPWARASRRGRCSRRWKISGDNEQTPVGFRHGWRPGGCHRIVPRDHRAHRGAFHRRSVPRTNVSRR